MSFTATRLLAIFEAMYGRFGPQYWWPADSLVELVVGAVLTQNTNWSNVTKAIDRLRAEELLSVEALLALPEPALAERIRPSGYYNLKARRLRNLLSLLKQEYDGEIEHLVTQDLATARQQLLGVKGIGPETADSILLYGAGKPIFVVDAYTHRIMSRHHLAPEECDYQTLQELFMDNLEPDAALFKEYHALLVMTAKIYCKKNKPLCQECPLKEE